MQVTIWLRSDLITFEELLGLLNEVVLEWCHVVCILLFTRILVQRHHAHLNFLFILVVTLTVDVNMQHWLILVQMKEFVQALVEGTLRKVLRV